MDKGQTTTRKGFLRRTGLAIAGVFAVGKGTRSASPSSKNDTRDHLANGIASDRLKPARGIVRYRS